MVAHAAKYQQEYGATAGLWRLTNLVHTVRCQLASAVVVS